MKELSVEQMAEIKAGGNALACGAMILVTAVGIAGGMGWIALGFFAASLTSSTSPC